MTLISKKYINLTFDTLLLTTVNNKLIPLNVHQMKVLKVVKKTHRAKIPKAQSPS